MARIVACGFFLRGGTKFRHEFGVLQRGGGGDFYIKTLTAQRTRLFREILRNSDTNSAYRNAKKVSAPSLREKSSRDGGFPPVEVVYS
ncbi:MAG: hypothetical protein UV80_C0005G0002 [Candidatus Peregrinibacteria bacterium GW2011_GWF2_43_17]|nr:MAG: hypothetical protein UV80_C0005G0002 [Candidatus Peregrinibacteria bacterium GW2011_GWF2_43_17]KKT19626.1 MAG: hypothetical protein UW03_C0015G0002 [Candidatus Peregrinibacteria bacterium GW2011_GWA2_43_8]HAU40081.1 hypothetical protein [Candidatus Peregrinibacteria bacterium]